MRKITAIIGAALLGSTLATGTPAPAQAGVVYDVKLSDYTTPGQTDSLAGVHAAMDALRTTGGTIYVDGWYNIRNYINLDRIPRTKPDGTALNISFVGSGPSSSGFSSAVHAPIFYQSDQTLRPEAGGNTSSPLRGQYRYNTVVRDMGLKKPAGSSGRVFSFVTGAQVNGRFENLNIDTRAADKGYGSEVFYFGYANQSHGNVFRSIRAEIRPGNPKGFLRVDSFSHGHNNNAYENLTVYNFGQTTAPCFELRPASGQYTNNAFRSITGQNCAGGFIHLYGQNGGGIYDSSNWDNPANTVYRDTIRLGKTSKTFNTTGFVLSGLGNVEQSLGQRALKSGRYLVAFGAGTSNITVQGVNATPKSTGLTY